MPQGESIGPEGNGGSAAGGGSGTVTSVSNSDGTITITGNPAVTPVVSISASEIAIINGHTTGIAALTAELGYYASITYQ